MRALTRRWPPAAAFFAFVLTMAAGSSAIGTPPRLTNRTLAPVVRSVPGLVGVSIGTDRLGSAPPLFAGNMRSGTGWSTTKVPVAITALNRFPRSRSIQNLAARAITLSDNDAAHALWNALGGYGASARAVDSTLLRFGDRRTVFRNVSPGLSTWNLRQQVIFTSRLACSTTPSAVRVRSLMTHIVSWESWGLGNWRGAAFKGGWGPDAYGRYTVRQMGILPYRGRWTAVAIAVIPPDGSFGTGVAELNRITAWLWRHRAQLPSFTCTTPRTKPTPSPSPKPSPTPTPTSTPSPTPTATATATQTESASAMATP